MEIEGGGCGALSEVNFGYHQTKLLLSAAVMYRSLCVGLLAHPPKIDFGVPVTSFERFPVCWTKDGLRK